MSAGPKVSLIDLSKQFRFEIDDTIKEKICFGETLLIGCGHFEGPPVDDSDSDWSCHSTTESEPEKTNVKQAQEYEIKDRVEEESDKKSESDDENDFHTFFFPDCSKPLPPKNSKASIIIGPDGMPKINVGVHYVMDFCVCQQDSKTMECKCVTKIPCSCGDEVLAECTCATLEGVCICREGDPQPKCTCKTSQTCICNPDDKVRPDCPCDNITPCICDKTRLNPTPVCPCKHKPGYGIEDDSFGSFEGAESEYSGMKNEPIPCDCQKPLPKKRCLCKKGQPCTCDLVCVCDIRKTCVCESEDGEPIRCESQESKSICSCPVPQICTCDAEPGGICQCFPKPKPTECTCGDPEDCKCFSVCECALPCICDIEPKKIEECTCPETGSIDCTCHPKSIIPDLSPLKLKKKRAGKHSYRWCHEVDPRHTYFDYAYERHDKICHKEEKREKVKILGLHDEKIGAETSAADIEISAPEYKKRVRKPTIDCCSTLGGMSINVESLGESKDKFLVQVTSHLSKEGAKAGTKLISILDCNLHTMEENRTEHIKKKDTMKERKSYMAICDTGYYNKITKICGERHIVKRFYHTFDNAHSFLLEGANVVLLRYFALSRYRGKIKTDTVLMDGVVCESIYVCHGVSQAIVNGKSMFVCKVERHIIEASGIVHQTLTILSLRGYLICHEWADNNYIVHLNPLLKTTPEKDLIEDHDPLRKYWREDLQLLSDYLDFKSARSSEGARYTSESSALTNSVRDYLQALLTLRPQDAMHFTKHYFKAALSSIDLPYNDYFDASTKHVRYFFFED